MYGVALRDGQFRKEYGVEIARKLSESSEVFVQGRRDDVGDMGAAVGVRVRW